MKGNIDYSVYLVTDSTPAILKGRDLVDVVEAAVRGGVGCVQLRDKTSDTAELISTARRLHEVTQRYHIPLLINDRVDVALAVRCEGVHIGQDDMELPVARQLLGPDAIIGVTVSTVEEALRACEGGADYLGIGTVYATATKTNTKNIIGAAGVQKILGTIAHTGASVRTVCIGGINESNVQRILHQSSSPLKALDGVAVVSAVVGVPDPEAAAGNLLSLVKTHADFYRQPSRADRISLDSYVPAIIKKIHDTTPLSHNMTNLVVQNFAANVALAMGASPIMANYGEEAADLCKLGGSLVINMGSVDPVGLANYVKALKAYNMARQPVVFDPVGAGATAVRRAAVKTIMAEGYLDVIKGNEGEIRTVWGNHEAQQRGVDSSSTLDADQKVALVQALATREKNVVIMTGKSDFVSDGQRTIKIDNGHEYLGAVTGTGCVLGTAVSAAVAVHKEDKLQGAVAAMLLFETAAEVAAARADVQGPGTFLPAFLDELYNLRQATAKGEVGWLRRVKITEIPKRESLEP
ncbi:Hydroxyethylthiazole kinase family-domain-containing protein [Lasiosphaeria hispida]|uniref:Hydroxyethylthiazole kinase family-domain-containing protein n=1 Tax=Lasiosphaeria hispida TaxID=260671 RepID=A0AAJ0HM62_9PEZI|nr:Hydroxyethylthiazole kinase family-domain-containing protein [Lasiosphaeria hispida]